jgi:haloacetate dehalogenase
VGAAIESFASSEIDTGEARIFVRWHGDGPPVLLLHGFPETHLMWRGVAPRLAGRFTVICADLRGYGRSGCPASDVDHAPYAKRAMARDMVAVMERFGFQRFAVVGHDRGGRVAYRLALDHPARVARLAVLDILPVDTVWGRADDRFALGYWPWSLLAQGEPPPERILVAAADAIVDAALGGWGSPAKIFPAAIRSAYVAALRDPAHAHAICEEYRAAAGIDRDHDRADRKNGRKIRCPTLALWSADGPLDTWYADGPLALWQAWCEEVQGRPITGGISSRRKRPRRRAADLLRRIAARPLGVNRTTSARRAMYR